MKSSSFVWHSAIGALLTLMSILPSAAADKKKAPATEETKEAASVDEKEEADSASPEHELTADEKRLIARLSKLTKKDEGKKFSDKILTDGTIAKQKPKTFLGSRVFKSDKHHIYLFKNDEREYAYAWVEKGGREMEIPDLPKDCPMEDAHHFTGDVYTTAALQPGSGVVLLQGATQEWLNTLVEGDVRTNEDKYLMAWLARLTKEDVGKRFTEEVMDPWSVETPRTFLGSRFVKSGRQHVYLFKADGRVYAYAWVERGGRELEIPEVPKGSPLERVQDFVGGDAYTATRLQPGEGVAILNGATEEWMKNLKE